MAGQPPDRSVTPARHSVDDHPVGCHHSGLSLQPTADSDGADTPSIRVDSARPGCTSPPLCWIVSTVGCESLTPAGEGYRAVVVAAVGTRPARVAGRRLFRLLRGVIVAIGLSALAWLASQLIGTGAATADTAQ